MNARKIFLFWLLPLILWLACSAETKRPTAVAGPDQTNVAVGTAVQLDGSQSSDPQSRPLRYAWSFASLPPGSEAELSGEDTAQPSFVVDQPGSYRLSLIVANEIAASDPAFVSITASKCGSNAPVVDSITFDPAKPNPGQSVGISAKVNHADVTDCKLTRSETFAWTLTKSPSGSSANLIGDDTANPSIVPDKIGEYEVTVVATDDLGHASAPKAQTFTVGKCGTQAPKVGTIVANPATPNMGDPVVLTAPVTDDDTMGDCNVSESFSYVWSFLSLPAASKATFNLVTAENPTFTPDVGGDYLIGLVVTDKQGHASAQQTAKISVQACGQNTPKVGPISASPAQPLSNTVVTLGAVVDDADNKPPCNLNAACFYQWWLTAVPAGSKAKLSSASAQNPSFTPDVVGGYTVQLVVTDPKGHKSPIGEQQVFATTCGNSPPNALVSELVPNAAGPQANLVGAPVALNTVIQLQAALAPANDPDNGAMCNAGQTLSAKWAITEQPDASNIKLNDAGISNPSFTPIEAGKYVVTLTVTDSTGLSSNTTFTVNADPAVNVSFPGGGFTITSLVAGQAKGYDGVRGVTKDVATGAIYTANFGTLGQNGANTAPRIRKFLNGAVTTVAKGGMLDNSQEIAGFDIAFDSVNQQLFVSASVNNMITVNPATGAQKVCQADWYRGLVMYTTANGTYRLLTGHRATTRVELIDPANCNISVFNQFNGNLNTHWGIAGLVRANSDDIFADDRAGFVFRVNAANILSGNNAGATIQVANNGATANAELRTIVTTPCPVANGHPKLIIADNSTNGNNSRLLLMLNQAGSPVTTFAQGFSHAFGLFFEDANNLLVTDEGFDALMRITGPFCTL